MEPQEEDDIEMPEEGQYWKPSQLAHRFNFSIVYVQKLCEGGEIPATKINKRWRIPPEAVAKMIERGSLLPPADKKPGVTVIEIPDDELPLVAPEYFEREESENESVPWWRKYFGL